MKVPTSLVDGAVAGSRLLTCEIPPIASGTTAKVTLAWSNGKPVGKKYFGYTILQPSLVGSSPPCKLQSQADPACTPQHLLTCIFSPLPTPSGIPAIRSPVYPALYKSFDGTNTLYSASWYTGVKLVDGYPTISGIGFSKESDYTCLWAVAGTSTQTDRTTAVYVSGDTLRCNVNLDGKGAVLAVYNGNQKMQVVVSPQIGANGKNYKDLANTKPSSIPFHTDLANGKALVYPYKETACGDGIKAENEIGVDCGIKACGKQCVWDGGQGSIEKGKQCDAHADCKSKMCDSKKGVCADGIFSCHNVKEQNSNAGSGFYKIAVGT